MKKVWNANSLWDHWKDEEAEELASMSFILDPVVLSRTEESFFFFLNPA